MGKMFSISEEKATRIYKYLASQLPSDIVSMMRDLEELTPITIAKKEEEKNTISEVKQDV